MPLISSRWKYELGEGYSVSSFCYSSTTRKIEIACMAAKADGLWMSQIAPSQTDAVDESLDGKRHLIHYRDPLFFGIPRKI